jgi:hypothetical protein
MQQHCVLHGETNHCCFYYHNLYETDDDDDSGDAIGTVDAILDSCFGNVNLRFIS